MKKIVLCFLLLLMFSSITRVQAQVDEDQFGGWYMYFWNTTLGEGPWGFQGDAQYRNWNVMGDLEQLLLRGGLTYQPVGKKAKFTVGYAYIKTGAFGDSKSFVEENRIYQEALVPHKLAERLLLTHRFRFEQRFVPDNNFRTRFRYNLFVNIPLNKTSLEPGAIYIALYNELFINGQKTFGENEVDLFDRNRLYGALGYSIIKGLRTQLGVMNQTTSN